MILRRHFRFGLAAAGKAAVCLLLTVAWPGHSATLQVVSIDLATTNQPEPAATPESRVSRAVAGLKSLQPDIALLQGVNDWKMCAEIVTQLKPAEYHVLVCSSFGAADPGETAPAQTAIIAKQRGYFSWTEPWRSSDSQQLPGGFAFASLNIAGEKVACFSFCAETPVPRNTTNQAGSTATAHLEPARQILSQVQAVQNWSLNRPGLFLAGGTLDPTLQPGFSESVEALFKDAGFEPVKSDSLRAAFFYSPRPMVDVRVTKAEPGFIVYQVHIDRTKIAGISPTAEPAAQARIATNAALAPSLAPNAASPVARKDTRAEPAWRLNPVLAVGAGAVGVCVVIVAFFGLRTRRSEPAPRLLAAPSNSANLLSSNYVIVAPRSTTGSTVETLATETTPAIHTHTFQGVVPPVRSEESLQTGVMPYLLRWLKERLVQKLIADRRQLLESHAEAEAQTIQFTQRLTRIEQQVQEQNRAYQLRIDDLTEELNAAREESRELLRIRIAQVKAEMESARAKLLASAKDTPR